MRFGISPRAVTVPINAFGGWYFSIDPCSQEAHAESRWL
jgi:hypothetical protein